MIQVALAVDGNSIAWRAFHASRSVGLRDGQGRPTGMAAVFLRMLRTALDAARADGRLTRCWVAWDRGVSWRREIYPAYKANRKAMDPGVREEFEVQRQWLEELLPSMGVIQTVATGWEADDWVAYLVDGVTDRGGAAVVFSGDKDLWQLVRPQVRCLYPSTGRDGRETTWVTTETLPALTGGARSPLEWLWVRCLAGDKSDCIEGVRGIGEVRALKAIREQCPLDHPIVWPEWSKTWKPIFERNVLLMDLAVASERLRSAFHHGQMARAVIPTAVDWDRVRSACRRRDMAQVIMQLPAWIDAFDFGRAACR